MLKTIKLHLSKYYAAKILLSVALVTLCTFAASAQTLEEEDDYANFEDPLQPLIDSLLNELTPDDPDIIYAETYRYIARIATNNDTTDKYSRLSLEYCHENDSDIIAENYYNIGLAYSIKGQISEAIPYLIKAADIMHQMDDKRKEGEVYILLAQTYEYSDSRDSIFYYYNKALKLFIEIDDTNNMSRTYIDIGKVYFDLDLFSSAKENFKKALDIAEKAQDTLQMASGCYWLGDLYYLSTDTSYYLSADYFKKCIRLIEQTQTEESYYIATKYLAYKALATTYLDIAKLTDNKKYADSCYIYLKKVGNYDLVYGNYYNYINTRIKYVRYLLYLKKYRDALTELKNLKQYVDYINYDQVKEKYYFYIYLVYFHLKDYEQALYNFMISEDFKHKSLNDSTLDVLKNAEIERTKVIEEIKLDSAQKVYTADKRRLVVVIISLIVGLLLVSALVFYIYRVLSIKKKANNALSQKNHLLSQQKAEIESQRDEIESQRDEIIAQRDEIATQQKEIVSSVTYAERIQRAAITSPEVVKSIFPDSFVFFRPRDIVGGDFYRAVKCGKYSVMIAADCTGHGIPGGFLSMLGISALKEFMVKEQDAEFPGTVLDRMRNFIKTTLVSDDSQGLNIRDGMDMSICCFDTVNMQLHYATANHKVYIIRKGETIKLIGDNMPVGQYIMEREHFQSLVVPLQEGDMVYMFSDGIPDQFGEKIQKKFLIRNLISSLVSFADQPADKQYHLLEKTIDDWRGNSPQMDDMTLVGIRVWKEK